MAAKKRKESESIHRYPTCWKLALDRRKEETHILSLPREIMFTILSLLPADVLHDVVRKVCKHWNGLLTDPVFIRAHSQTSSTGFLIQEYQEIDQAYYIEFDNGRLKVSNVHIPFPAIITGDINGLVLLHDMTNKELYHVMNLVTKVKVTLPPVVGQRPETDCAGIGVDTAGRYKVVQVSPIDDSKQLRMRIFTLGVDKGWRFIDLHGISMRPEVWHALVYRPLFIAGFFIWHNSWSDLVCFAMDVDTETIYPFYGPKGIRFCSGAFLNMGTTLGVYKLGKFDALDIRIWKLTDIRLGEWTELAGIDFKAMVERVDRVIKKLYPGQRVRCSPFPINLIDGILWFGRCFSRDKNFVVGHNIANESFVYFQVKLVTFVSTLFPHLHSLVSLKNC